MAMRRTHLKYKTKALNELTKASQNELFYTQVLIIKNGDLEEKVVLKELQKDPAKGKFLHADFLKSFKKN